MKRVSVVVKNLVPGTLTNPDALPLFIELDKIVANGDSASLSFEGISSLSSSFLNSSLGELMDKYSTDILKGKIAITGFTPEIATFIKNYISSFRTSYHS